MRAGRQGGALDVGDQCRRGSTRSRGSWPSVSRRGSTRSCCCCMNESIERVERQVGEPVGIVRHEHLIVLSTYLRTLHETLADVGIQPGVDEGDLPVVDVLGDAARRLLAAAGQHEIVGDALVVVQEIVLDGVAAIAQAQDEFPVTVMRVVTSSGARGSAGSRSAPSAWESLRSTRACACPGRRRIERLSLLSALSFAGHASGAPHDLFRGPFSPLMNDSSVQIRPSRRSGRNRRCPTSSR